MPMVISDGAVSELQRTCLDVRRDIIDMLHHAGSGHPGGSLSAVETLVALYFEVMRIRPEEPAWSERDRFILSKGHAAPALYVVLARRGFFPREMLRTFNAPGTRLQKHIDMHEVPGTELSTGSLGQGLSVAVGMALADRLDKKDRRVFVLLSDGESQEGQVWEAAMAASQFGLGNITAVLDYNGCQVDGFVDQICSLEPVEAKWSGFGWDVQRVDGHDVAQILAALENARSTPDVPHMIVADTVKGKGISYMENDPDWHSKPIGDQDYRIAVADLEAIDRKLGERRGI